MTDDVYNKMLHYDDETTQMICKLGDGNPGALAVLVELYHKVPAVIGKALLKTLEAEGCTGDRIWMRYKDDCHKDIVFFMNATLLGWIVMCQEKLEALTKQKDKA